MGGATATPDRPPAHLAPLPERLEDFALRFAWVIVAINLAGTAFGFWYYRFQFAQTPAVMWPVVPDSPAATLLMALSLAAWKAGYNQEWLNALAFFGNIKLGLWTPYVQLALNGPEGIALWLYQFLIWSHLAMALQAFLIHRYSGFPVGAVAVAAVWYWFNDLVDYFVPIVGDYHHTFIRAEVVAGTLDHSLPAHDFAAAVAVTLTLASTVLALATKIEKVRQRATVSSQEASTENNTQEGGS